MPDLALGYSPGRKLSGDRSRSAPLDLFPQRYPLVRRQAPLPHGSLGFRPGASLPCGPVQPSAPVFGLRTRLSQSMGSTLRVAGGCYLPRRFLVDSPRHQRQLLRLGADPTHRSRKALLRNMLTIAYITSRRDPKLEWFLSSLGRELAATPV